MKEISFDIELVSRGRVTIDITVPDMEVNYPLFSLTCDPLCNVMEELMYVCCNYSQS